VLGLGHDPKPEEDFGHVPRYNLIWNRLGAQGRSVPAGVCFCTLSAENQLSSRKVVLTE